MNRKRIALLTSLTLLAGTVVNTTNPLRNATTAQAGTTQSKADLKPNSKYPDVTKKLDITSIEQYASNGLFMNVTLKKFYVKDTATDGQGQTYLLLAPIKTSNQYFLTKIDTTKTIKAGQKISLQGFLNGKVKLVDDQINIGLNKKYLNKKAVSMMTDNFSL